MPAHKPPYRQAFRVYDPRETEPDIRLDERFHLAIAAPFCAREVEVAVGLLFYGQTGITIDWVEIFGLVGASKRTAYSFAYSVPGCFDRAASSPSAARAVAESTGKEVAATAGPPEKRGRIQVCQPC